MKRAIIASFLILSLTFTYAQGHDIIWENSYGGTKNDITKSGCLAFDGGYIIAGNTGSSNGDVSGNHGITDAWVIKLDVLGDLVWHKCIGSDKAEIVSSICNTNDGGYLIAGYYNTNIGWNNFDIWIVKLDNEGNVEWESSLGGTSGDIALNAIQTNDGGYICVGSTNSTDGDVAGNHGHMDCWVVKLSNTGELEWQKCYGGSDYERALSIIELEDGSFVFAAETTSDDGDVSFNNGIWDVWIVKIDQLGNLIWERSYGGSAYEGSSQIVSSTNGGYTIASYSSSNDGDVTGVHGANGAHDIWLLEIDEYGALIWEKCYGGTGIDIASSILKTQENGNIIVGRTQSNNGDVNGNHGDYDCWIIKTDNVGNLEWQQCYGGSSDDRGEWIFQSANGNYIIPTTSNSDDGDVSGNHGRADYWIFEIGEHIPVIPMGSSGIIISVLLIAGVFVVRRVRSV